LLFLFFVCPILEKKGLAFQFLKEGFVCRVDVSVGQ